MPAFGRGVFPCKLAEACPRPPAAILAFILKTDSSSLATVSHPLKSILALWFVLQIVLPFTAPLQTCDLSDLLGARHHRTTRSPESSATPTPANEFETDGNAFLSPLAASTLRVSIALAVADRLAMSGSATFTSGLAPSRQVQQTILRL
jgi:hypothetical protein